jgi:DNA-binding transcriptional LysR family regulator
LGANLLKRTTRVVQVTEIGRVYYEQVQDVLAQLASSDESVRAYQASPTGTLRISTMVTFGEEILMPLLNEFKHRYPEIVLDVSFSDELSTLSRDEVDIAIRGGYAPNERVQAVRLMDNEFIPVASPEYLATNGTPKKATDLRAHHGLFFRTPHGPSPWLCEQDGQWLDVSGKIFSISNNATWLRRQVALGQGICMAPRWLLKQDLESGVAQELMIRPQLRVNQNKDMAIFLLYQKQQYRVPKVKVAVDFLIDRIQSQD